MRIRLRLLLLVALAVFGSAARVSAQVIDTQYLTVNSTDCSTAGSCASFDPGASPSVTYSVSGTFTATLTFEGTADGVNWVSINVVNVATSVNATTTTAVGTFSFSNSGFVKVRVRCSAYTSGTAKIVATRGWAVARLFSPVVTSIALGDGSVTAPSATFASNTGTGLFYNPTTTDIYVGDAGNTTIRFGQNLTLLSTLGWSTAADLTSADLAITRDAANVLAQRNGTNAQAFRVYGTFTDASNYERVTMDYAAGTGGRLFTSAAGTGTSRELYLGAAATLYWKLGTTGNLTGITASGGIGYGTGAGGTVTQGAGSGKATGVTLNTVTGQITLNNASLAASTAVAFTLTDSAIAATDLVYINHVSAGTAGAYSFTSTPGAGSTVITVRNLTAGALAEAIVIQFAVIKGATS